MLIHLAVLAAGLALLMAGSDRFVAGAAGLARNLGISPMVVGLTVVAIGTSAPEMLVSAMAAYAGNPGIAIGNVVGSNIANITLVLGASAVAVPLLVASDTLRREFPLVFAVTALAWVLIADARLSRIDAALLLLAMVGVLWFIVRTARAARRSDPLRRELDEHHRDAMPLASAIGRTVIGLSVLLVGSRLVVYGASQVASALGVSDLVIGLTVVAVGTSLPELAASLASALRGEPDMAVGNVLGSNIFNLLPVLAIAGLIQPFGLDAEVLTRDVPIMAALTVVLFFMCMGWRGPGQITRTEGSVLLAMFVGYQGVLYTVLA